MIGRAARCARLQPWGLAAALAVLPVAAAAQRPFLDAGTFSISEGGRIIGREQFSTTRGTGGSAWALELRSDAARGDTTVSWRMQVDSAGRPVSARRETRVAGGVVARATGAQARGRFATLARDATREAAREHRLTPSTRLIDSLLVHPWMQLVPALRRDGSLRLITLDGHPDQLARTSEPPVPDSVVIGASTLAAERWSVRVAAEPVTIWLDTAARVLAVEWPRRARRAVRDDPPVPGPP